MSRQMARAPKRRRLNAREEEKEGGDGDGDGAGIGVETGARCCSFFLGALVACLANNEITYRTRRDQKAATITTTTATLTTTTAK